MLSRSMHFIAIVNGLLAILNVVLAAPSTEISRRQGITTLSSAQVAAFKPFSFFASTAYCNPSATLTWTCGANCNANPSFQPIASGGDGVVVQFWFVGYDPTHQAIIVSHQGTDPAKILPLITDINIIFTPLNPNLFPGVSSDVQVHDGFANAQGFTASLVLSAVQSGISQYNTNTVIATGHSLGAAISLLDAVYLYLQLPTAQIKFYGYGLPRVGNENFANYVDESISYFNRITNLDDPVPILPPEFLGYHHPSGESHINDDLSWKVCPGQDNPSSECSVGDTPNIFVTNITDHAGPYDGVEMGCP